MAPMKIFTWVFFYQAYEKKNSRKMYLISKQHWIYKLEQTTMSLPTVKSQM